jgi:peptide methionine sulfoxide reductase msrA/msrB
LYWTTQAQEKDALNTKKIFQTLLTEKGFGKINTEIKELNAFYPAESYHQNYLANHPNGYCPNHQTGVYFANKPLSQ